MSEVLHAQILDGTLAMDALRLRLAAQTAPRRWRQSLAALASQIDRGDPLELAIAQQQKNLPPELRCLLQESLRVHYPTTLVLEAVRIRNRLGQSWRELMSLVLYPLVLFAAALLVGVLFTFTLRSALDLSTYEKFELPGAQLMLGLIDDQHQAIVGLALCFAWVVLVLATLVGLAPRWAWSSVLSGLFLIGRPMRWMLMCEMIKRYQLFIEQGLSSLAAAEAADRSFRQSSQAIAAAAVTRRLQAGMSLGQALCMSAVSDGLSRPLLRLLDLQGSQTPHALSETAELLGRLTEQRCRGLSTILPAMLLIMVGGVIWNVICAYLLGFLPFISIMTSMI